MSENWLSAGLNRLMGVPSASSSAPEEPSAESAAAATAAAESSSTQPAPAEKSAAATEEEASVDPPAAVSIDSVPPLPAPKTRTPSKPRSKKKFVFWKGKAARSQGNKCQRLLAMRACAPLLMLFNVAFHARCSGASSAVRGAMHPPVVPSEEPEASGKAAPADQPGKRPAPREGRKWCL